MERYQVFGGLAALAFFTATAVYADSADKNKQSVPVVRPNTSTLADLNFGCNDQGQCRPGIRNASGSLTRGTAIEKTIQTRGTARGTAIEETILPPPGPRITFTRSGFPNCTDTLLVGSGNYLSTDAVSVPIGADKAEVDYSARYALTPAVDTTGEAGFFAIVKARRFGQTDWQTVASGWGVTSPSNPRFSSFNTQRLNGVVDLAGLPPGGAPAGAVEFEVEQFYVTQGGFTASTNETCSGILTVIF